MRKARVPRVFLREHLRGKLDPNHTSFRVPSKSERRIKSHQCSSSLPPRRRLRPPLTGDRVAALPHASAARACASLIGPRAARRCRRWRRRSGWCWCGTGRAPGTRTDASRGAPTSPCSRPRGSPRRRPRASCSSPTPSTPASPARSPGPAAPRRSFGTPAIRASSRTPTSARSTSIPSRWAPAHSLA